VAGDREPDIRAEYIFALLMTSDWTEGTSIEVRIPDGNSCRPIPTYDRMRDAANAGIYGRCPMIRSGLKPWLETGELLDTPGSMMFGKQAATDYKAGSRTHATAAISAGCLYPKRRAWSPTPIANFTGPVKEADR
jgi:hypothetical protein